MLLLPRSYKIFAIKYSQTAINYLHKPLLCLPFLSVSAFYVYFNLCFLQQAVSASSVDNSEETLRGFFLLLFYTHSTTFYGTLYISTSHSSFKQFPHSSAFPLFAVCVPRPVPQCALAAASVAHPPPLRRLLTNANLLIQRNFICVCALRLKIQMYLQLYN